MISAIVLAAGLSSRMAKNKLLLPFKDHTVVEEVISILLDTSISEVIVVLGRDVDALRALLERPIFKTSILTKRMKLIYNPDFEKGQSTSVKCGLNHMNGQSEAVFFVMGDQPLITQQVIEGMMESLLKSKWPLNQIVVPKFKDQSGAPVLFGAVYRAELLKVEGDQGGRPIVKKHIKMQIPYEVESESFFWDVDTDEAYIKIMQFLEAQL